MMRFLFYIWYFFFSSCGQHLFSAKICSNIDTGNSETIDCGAYHTIALENGSLPIVTLKQIIITKHYL